MAPLAFTVQGVEMTPGYGKGRVPACPGQGGVMVGPMGEGVCHTGKPPSRRGRGWAGEMAPLAFTVQGVEITPGYGKGRVPARPGQGGCNGGCNAASGGEGTFLAPAGEIVTGRGTEDG